MPAITIIIAALAAASSAFAVLFFRGRCDAARQEYRAETLSKEASDLRCQVARLEERDGGYMKPLTKENIAEYLRKEVAPKVDVSHENMVVFETDATYLIDCGRLPQQVILRKGYGVDKGSVHWEAAREASLAVVDSLVMVRMHVNPEDCSYDFMIVSADRTVGSLRQNMPEYMSIIAEAEKLFSERYREILVRDYPEVAERLEADARLESAAGMAAVETLESAAPEMDQKTARQTLLESLHPSGTKS